MAKSEANSSTITSASRGAPSVTSAAARTRALLALVAATAIWGSTFVVTKALLDEAAPFFIAAARFAIAFAVLWPLLAWRGSEPAAFCFRPAFLALGLLGVAGNFGLQNLGLAYTGAADAALIVALTPVPIAVLAALFLEERLVGRQLLGIGISICGVVLITGAAGDVSAAAVLGDVLIAVSTLAWAGYTLLGKRLAPRYTAATIATGGIGWGVAILLPVALVEAILVSPPELSLLGVAALAYLGIAASAATFVLWNYALNAVGASVAGTFLNLIPVFGVAFALLAGESLSLVQLGGGAAVGFGVWLAATASGRWFPAADPRRAVT
jgi:drug/metabolite transporter (DMT)-like permease